MALHEEDGGDYHYGSMNALLRSGDVDQASVAQWIRAVGFYPMCRGFESCRGCFLLASITVVVV